MGMLILYILTWLSFSLVWRSDIKRRGFLGCTLLTILTVAVVYIFMKVGRPNYYYNTLIIYSLGCWYALFQEKIESILMRNDFNYVFCLTLLVAGYCYTYLNRWNYGIEGYTVWAALFTLLFLMISMKFSFRSNILSWFGEHVFSVYILQRIPMMILKHVGLAENHRYMFLVMALLMTIVLAIIFEKFIKIIERYIFLNGAKKNS